MRVSGMGAGESQEVARPGEAASVGPESGERRGKAPACPLAPQDAHAICAPMDRELPPPPATPNVRARGGGRIQRMAVLVCVPFKTLPPASLYAHVFRLLVLIGCKGVLMLGRGRGCVCDLPFAVRLGGWAQVSW